MSLNRYIEGAAYRIAGARGLGFAAGVLWTRKRFRSRPNLTVLAIANDLFQKDLSEIDRERKINWLFLHKNKYGRSQNRLVPQELRQQRFYYPSLSDPKYQANWRDIEQFGLALMRAVQLRGHIDAVLSAHVDYWQDEGLRRACEHLGIPFLVLCQENYNVAKTYRARAEELTQLRFRFGGAAIATFSEHMRELFVRSQVCSADRVMVTGAPRFDGWRQVTIQPGRRIVLLSYLDSEKYYVSRDAFLAVLDGLRRAVGSAPGWELIVKCKNANGTRAVLKHVGTATDLRVGHDMHLPELLSTASIIVGANSLSMVESLLSDAELIVPSIETGNSPTETRMFDPSDDLVAQCIAFPNTIYSLERHVLSVIERGQPAANRNARLALLQRYIHYTERQSSSSKVIEFIDKYARAEPRTSAPGRSAGAEGAVVSLASTPPSPPASPPG